MEVSGQPEAPTALTSLNWCRLPTTRRVLFIVRIVGRDTSVGIATLRAGRPGDRIPVEARFSTPFQTCPGAHPASCAVGTGSFPGLSDRILVLTTQTHLAPRLKKEQSYTSNPHLGLRGLL